MMLRFQWDSLRRGDHIRFHDARFAGLELRPAVVELVDSTRGRRDVAVRCTDGLDAGRLVRPGRFASHLVPLSDADSAACWRCVGAAAA